MLGLSRDLPRPGSGEPIAQMDLLRAAPPQRKAAVRPSLVALGLLLGAVLLLTLFVEWEWEELGVRARLRSPSQRYTQPPKRPVASLDGCPQASQPILGTLVGEEAGKACSSDPPADSWRSDTTPSVVLRRALAYEGDMLRMDRFLHKVVEERKPVTVLAMGGSITSEFGGRKGPQMKMLNLEEHEFSRVVNPDGWLSGSLDWLTKTYPPKENKVWTNGSQKQEEPYSLLNVAIGAVGPIAWDICLGTTYLEQLPEQVDLVTIDWAISPCWEYMEHFDGVLQKLLTWWDPPPAILIVNFFFWCRGNLWCRDLVDDPNNPGEKRPKEGPQNPRDWSNLGVFAFQSFDDTGDVLEDNATMLAQYYSLPSLSMRNAFYTLAGQTLLGYGLHDLIGYDDMGIHPSIAEARGRYADVLIYFFRQAIAAVSCTHLGMRVRRASSDAEFSAGTEKDLLAVPPPFFKRWKPEAYGTRQAQTKACYSYSNLLGLFPPASAMQGFDFNKDNDSWVEFTLNTDAVGSKVLNFDSEAEARAAQALVMVEYLVSYERMGAATLACVRGCLCTPGRVSATHGQHNSIPDTHTLEVTQDPKCLIRVTSEKGQKGSKFKILGITVMFLPAPPAS
eukprot:SM000101S09275  [mRNA]  locus=s101:331156:334845:+ [translate_table: standard]